MFPHTTFEKPHTFVWYQNMHLASTTTDSGFKWQPITVYVLGRQLQVTFSFLNIIQHADWSCLLVPKI